MSRTVMHLALAAAFAVSAGAARAGFSYGGRDTTAVTYTWTGEANDGLWANPGNWTGGGTYGIPASELASAAFDPALPTTVISGQGNSYAVSALSFGGNSTAEVTLKDVSLDVLGTGVFSAPAKGTLTFDNSRLRTAKGGDGLKITTVGKLVFQNGASVLRGDIANKTGGGNQDLVFRNGTSVFNGTINLSANKNAQSRYHLTLENANVTVSSSLMLGQVGTALAPTVTLDANSTLSAWKIVNIGTAFNLNFTLPAVGTTSAPLIARGTGDLAAPVTFIVDARACTKNGSYPLVRAGGLKLYNPTAANFGYTLNATCASGMSAKLALSDDGRAICLVLSGGSGAEEDTSFGIRHPLNGSVATLLTPNQIEFLEMPYDELRRVTRATSWDEQSGDSSDAAVAEQFYLDNEPQPLVLTWRGTSGNCAVKVVRKSDNKVFFNKTVSGTFAEVYDLEVGTVYVWTLENGGKKASAEFTTDPRPIRIINGHGIGLRGSQQGNMRDLGGWIGLGGKRVRQGLLFRSAEPDNHTATFEPYCTDTSSFRDVLGLKSEIDLRNPKEGETPQCSGYGDSVTWLMCNIPQYGALDNDVISGVITGEWLPAVVHCAAGKDRTGTYAFYTLALLGVSKEDIWRDYLFTGGASGAGQLKYASFEALFTSLATKFPGDTLADQAENYFVNKLRFSAAQVSAFRTFMLEGAACDHSSYETIAAKDATCTTSGNTAGKRCKTCLQYFDGYQQLPALGHLWDDGSVTQEPSCSAAGVKTFACTRTGCDATKTESIAKTAHTFVEGECSVCGAKEGGEDPGDDPDQPTGESGTCAEPTETKTLGDGSTVMIFRSTEGTLEFTKPAGVTEIQYLVVGGGGGGGANGGRGNGGGGAGGFREGTLTVGTAAMTGTVTVGVGGAAGANGTGSTLAIGSATLTVGGGTAGAPYDGTAAAATDASAGGAGGGSKVADGAGAAATCATGVFGSAGGGAPGATNTAGGGGGGAGGVGGSSSGAAAPGAGGAGKESTITGTGVTYAAGGNGAGTGSAAASVKAPANSTGNGGNAIWGADGTHGASGVVIIRFGGTGEPGTEEPEQPGGEDDPVVPGGEDNPGAIELSAYCQSNMVLQRGKPITIWGRNTAGRVMTVAFAGKTATGTTGSDGYWQVTFAESFALSATPQAMTVSDNAGHKVTLSNILVGDVYLCGGQSNMDFLLREDKKSVQKLCVGDDGIRFRRIGKANSTVESAYAIPANTDGNVGCDWVSTTDETLRLQNLSSVAANFARRIRQDNPGVPLGLVVVSKGGTAIRAHIASSAIARAGLASEKGDGGYWNAMIAPIVRASFRGAIWYQGCSDGGKTVEEYLALMKCLVADWRARWGADFGFYCAQIAMPDQTSSVPDTGYPAPTLTPYALMNSVHVREAQRLWFEQDTGAHKGLAITCESTMVALHPTDKSYIGERLALWALRDFYNGTANPSGPRFVGSENIGNGRVRISFATGTAVGLTSGYRQNASVQNLGSWSARPNEQIKGFALCGSDGRWSAADTVTVDGESLIIQSASVASPTKFHYGCWNHTVTTDSDGVIVQNLSLYNSAGLPMSPQWPTEVGSSVEPPAVCDHVGFVVTDAAVAATCTATGLTEGSHCSNCGAVLVAQQQLAALGHDWDEGVVTTGPTATTDGVKTFTCQRSGCGATKTETIPATGGGDEPGPTPVVVGEWGYELTLAGGDVVRVYTNTSGTVEWTVPSGVTQVRYLVVGGGGGGGYGGGGGGYALEDTASVQPGSLLAVSVGAGGGGGADGANGTKGCDSSLSGALEVTAEGGGYGGGVDQDGGDGGCGGGGAKNYSGGRCTQGPSGYGGTGGGSSYSGSGAGVTGRNAAAKDKMAEGGAGLVSSITGAEVEYGKGGQGQTTSTPATGVAGTDGTGTGGGGSRSGAGAKGGDGVVILRYSPGGGGDDPEPTCDHSGTIVTDAAVPATCTATGLTEGSHCSKCGTVIVAQEVTDMIPHHFEDGECTMCHTKDPSVHGEDWGYERTMDDGSVLRVYTNTADTLSWQVPAAGIQLRYLVVGGGGGGGTGIADENKFGGGGGAGGFARGWTEVAGGTALQIVVGAGGAGATDSRTAETLAGHGGASSLALAGGAAIASVEGGGAGGSTGSYANANGACGGGAGRNGKIGTGSQGGNGGPGSAGTGTGGGGGGLAGDGILLEGGAGLAEDITGASVIYSAGGFGGKANRTPVAGADGTGEGGDGAAGALVGAKGGDGVVILRYYVISDPACAHAETRTVGEGRAATCEQDGQRQGVQCKACGYWLVKPEILPALGHDFDENDVCRHCGLNRIETVPDSVKNLAVPSYWQDHLVIQRGKPLTVWGRDTAGRTVTVYFGGKTATGVADANGDWQVTFAEPFALSTTPRTLTVADDAGESRHLHDVLVGDVWLAGGQSNMDRRMDEDGGEFQSVRDFCAADAGIRFRRVARDRKTEEQSFDLPVNGGSTLGVNWATCASEETRNSVSATALNFATCLRKRFAQDGQDIPIGIVQVSFGGTGIRQHIAASALAAAGLTTAEMYDSQVWNAMIAPLKRVNFTGVIWYQGCTDAANKTAEEYAEHMQVLVAEWRAHWGADLPFYATQIGFPGTTTARGIDHRPAPTLTPGEHNYAQIREGQRLWCERETGLHGLAIVCDGALEALHPHDKRLPGERLSRWALRDVYGFDVEPRGPTFAKAVRTANGQVRVTFAAGTAAGLTTGVYHPATETALGFFETTTASVVGFALCGADGEWKEATAVIDGAAVLLQAEGVTEPVKFHYGSWCMTRKVDGTQYINLYNGAGLPLSPIAPQDVETSGGDEEEITNPAFTGGSDADKEALAKVMAWAAAHGVTVAQINAMEFTKQAATGFLLPADDMAEKFLLNLSPVATAEQLATEKAAFRFTAITPGGEPTVYEPERGYNGEVKILRSAAADGTYSVDATATDGRLFYKAVLVR